jgi:hypothetical protein
MVLLLVKMQQWYIHICALADSLLYISSFLVIQGICKSTISMRILAHLLGLTTYIELL